MADNENVEQVSSTENSTPAGPSEVKLANAQCKLKDGRVIPVVIDASKVEWMLSNENDICRQVERVVGRNIVPIKPILLKVTPSTPTKPTITIPEDAVNRYTWQEHTTEKLLDTIKLWWKPLRNARNKRLIWSKIAEQVAPDLNADKVIDKWKFMKRKYRKMYPEPFLFSEQIRDLLGDLNDATDFTSNVEFLTIDETAADTDTAIVEALFEPSAKKRKTEGNESESGTAEQPDVRMELFYEMKKMIEERDEKMMQMFREFQADNARLLQQLIDKFPEAN